ncbi:DNA polymerase III subunit gamma/tau [Chlamydiales bacterium STE3]|nr:DNA polymerase III subunit gamma/tau [Chlamydiales bacterium STE3]
MNDYQGIARKFRPQTFDEVVGQDVIVTTLKNAIKYERLAHAYLFCGSRGTGKTTLARIFAKALNCLCPLANLEPCNQCASCREILSGSSLDVLEIDGASNRSIDDIRKINDNVAYATSNGKFKIYIIDEVHMLTKEAFNALLKTLEEPPAKVKFFFATTEPHKVLPTILSRCQRFNLKRLSVETIVQKLQNVIRILNREVSEPALRQIALKAEGGLRDAESILDQILAYHEGAIEEETVAEALGVVSKEIFFTFDHEAKAGNLAIAFHLSAQLFSEGKDLPFFVEGLLEHFRNLSIIKLSGKNSIFLPLTQDELERYAISANFYSKEQLLMILDICIEAHQQIRQQPSLRIAIESLLLRIIRSHSRIPIEQIVDKLALLEQKVQEIQEDSNVLPPSSQNTSALMDNQLTQTTLLQETTKTFVSVTPTLPIKSSEIHVSEDPSPTFEDLNGIVKEKTVIVAKVLPEEKPTFSPQSLAISKQKQAQYDTLLQFASVELDGRIRKN